MIDPATLVLAGSAVLYGISALLKGRGAKDEASAKAIVSIVAQQADLATRCQVLERQVLELNEKLDAEQEQRRHFETQVKLLSAELAVWKKRAEALAAELAELIEKGKPSTKSYRPGKPR